MLGSLVLAGSKVKTDPNLTCCITGNLQRTSARYIFTSPEKTLDQSGTPEMFHNWLECSWKGPDLTLWMFERHANR